MTIIIQTLLISALALVVASEDGYQDHYYTPTSEAPTATTTYAAATTTTEEATEPPKRQCYQCSFSPGKTIYKERIIAKRIEDPKTGKFRIVREKNVVPVRQAGGWDKCGGSFTPLQAEAFGIDTWDCEHNCFVRVNKAGFLFRGCYRGEFGVDPNNTEDIQQIGGSQYKFCSDNLCNNF